MKRFILKFFQCLLTYMICVNIIKHKTIETACRWNVFSSSVTKRKCHKSRFRTFKFKSVLHSVSTTCTCNTNSGTSCSPSSYLSGGIEPHSLSSSLKYKSCISFETQWSNYIFTSTGRDTESTISTCELNRQRIL